MTTRTKVDPLFAKRLSSHLAIRYPKHRLVEITPLAPDTGATKGSTAKGSGFGMPVRLRLVDGQGGTLELVWRTATPNEFGHDRRSDRAANTMLARDDFPNIPRHVEAIELGSFDRHGNIHPLGPDAELYLLTTFARGTIYANDLRRVAHTGSASELDLARVDTLARYLVDLHQPLVPNPVRYRRAIRDLVGHGEGIFGIVDGFPDGVAGAPLERIRAIEEMCGQWRWRLRDATARLVRTHGDFHPFNVVFDGETELALLDASRGTAGDAADDVTAMAINYVFFALSDRSHWKTGLGALWHRFWQTYESERHDDLLRMVAPPYFAWRALVLCNPRFYPDLPQEARDSLVWLAMRALGEGRLDPAWADELFSGDTTARRLLTEDS